MPIVNHNSNPSLERIGAEGLEVISISRAQKQDIRELHIGFLNMMPDAAFVATERQFFRLIGASNRIVQIYIHPIILEGVKRSDELSEYINQYYESFEQVKQQGLDALIVTGANPGQSDLINEDYFKHATEIFNWADKQVSSVFFSCLASHAMLEVSLQIKRKKLEKKIWGVFQQKVVNKNHPLVSNINTRFDMPHSRNNDISEKTLLDNNIKILVKGEECGVSLATSSDGIRKVFCQGHPEYDCLSLYKEFKRELNRFYNKEINIYPEFPKYTFLSKDITDNLKSFKQRLTNNEITIDEFPSNLIEYELENTWTDTAKSIFSNWLGIVYQLTNVDRNKQFMDEIDPNNPLQLNN